METKTYYEFKEKMLTDQNFQKYKFFVYRFLKDKKTKELYDKAFYIFGNEESKDKHFKYSFTVLLYREEIGNIFFTIRFLENQTNGKLTYYYSIYDEDLLVDKRFEKKTVKELNDDLFKEFVEILKIMQMELKEKSEERKLKEVLEVF